MGNMAGNRGPGVPVRRRRRLLPIAGTENLEAARDPKTAA